MRRRVPIAVLAALTLAMLGPWVAGADTQAPDSAGATPAAEATPAIDATPEGTPGAASARTLEAMVPELATNAYRIQPGAREFRHRLSISPGYGYFGSDRLFTLRAAFNPDAWLGYEASLSHDPGHAVHAVVHTLSVIVRRPLPGRLQPYLSGGYGMVIVYPGRALNAAPITKNTLAIGGGTELYVRSDLALRVDLRNATVLGKQRDREGIVAYNYAQGTVGLAFYRSIQP